MDSCTDFQMLLSAYVDGEVEGRELGHVETHLSGCNHCRLRVDDLRALGRVISAAIMAEADAADFTGFADSVLKRVSPKRAPFWERLSVSWSELLAYHRTALVSSMAAAGVALLVGMPAAYWMAGKSGGSTQPQLAMASAGEPIVIRELRVDNPNLEPVVMNMGDGQVVIMLVEKQGAGQAVPLDLNTKPPSGGDL